ncbi:hypothetical protein D3C85_554560 [compost metagenome]
MPRIISPLDNSIKLPTLQRAFLEHLGLIAVPSIGEEASELLPPEGERTFKRQLYLLSPLWDTETVRYKELIAKYGGREPYRLMAILEFSDVYSQGFGMTIFGKDIERTMNKKIRRFSAMLDGSGCPPFNAELHDEPHFVPR